MLRDVGVSDNFCGSEEFRMACVERVKMNEFERL